MAWGLAASNALYRGLGLMALGALAACSDARPDADRLELATIPYWHEIPKSSPYLLVRAFDRFCVNRAPDAAAQDAGLRAAGYVPKVPARGRRPAVYVVDDRRPAVVSGERICGVRAISRTGQTDRVNRYVQQTFAGARPVSPKAFSTHVEQAWQIDGGMIATMRSDWAGNRSAYTVTIFRPGT